MFKKALEAAQLEKDNLLNLFQWLKSSKEKRIYLSLELLVKKGISLEIVTQALTRLKVPFNTTDSQFMIYLTKEEFANRLDEEYPEESVEDVCKEEPVAKKIAMEAAPIAPQPSDASSLPVASGIAARCQDILDTIRRENEPRSATKPLYSNETQQAMLIDYLREALASLEPIQPQETKAAYDAKIRQHQSQRNAFKQQFIQDYAPVVLCDDIGEPVIFSEIQKQLRNIETEIKINLIENVFRFPREFLVQLSQSNKGQLQQLFIKTQQATQLVASITEIFQYLCERGGVPNAVRVVQHVTPCGASDITDPLNHLSIELIGENEAIGYSLHNVLQLAEIIPDGLYAGNGSGRFEDQAIFILNYQQIKTLKTYLSDLAIWYRDFENILSALFGEDAHAYIKTGCKPLHEAVKTEVEREKSREPLFLTQDVRERFNHHSSQPFLLFGQAAINLDDHPQREEMRDLFQGFYDTCGLQDSKKQRKTFVLDERGDLTFVSLLSIGHIRQIYNEIMALSTLTKVSKEMGFTSLFDYVAIIGGGNAKTLYHTYLQLMLVDIVTHIMPQATHETKDALRRRIEMTVGRLLPEPEADETFSAIYQRFQQQIQMLLNQHTDILRAPITRRIELEPTQEEKMRLLPPAQRRDNNFRIYDNTTLDHLVAQLKACSAYQAACDEYLQYFTSVGAESITSSAQSYRRDTIYMHPTLDACIDNLVSEIKRRQSSDELTIAKDGFLRIVLKMVYARKMNISSASIKRAAARFADILKIDDGRADLDQGCNTGFAGRVLTVETQLIAAEEIPFMQFNKQLLIDQAEVAFSTTLGSAAHGESSMSARCKPLVNIALGLQEITPERGIVQLRERAREIQPMLEDLTSRYTPGYIYEENYKYICDEFKRHIREDDHGAMQALLSSLGYTEDDSLSFQMDGKWNIKCFEVFLPEKLIGMLFSHRLLCNGEGHLLIDATEQRYSFVNAIQRRQRRQERVVPRESIRSASMFQPASQQASSGGSWWSLGSLLYQPQQRPSRSEVDLRGDSKQSQDPGTGSRG